VETPALASETQIAIHQRIATKITNTRMKKRGIDKSNHNSRGNPALQRSVNFIGNQVFRQFKDM
jgi:hypothetical protein